MSMPPRPAAPIDWQHIGIVLVCTLVPWMVVGLGVLLHWVFR